MSRFFQLHTNILKFCFSFIIFIYFFNNHPFNKQTTSIPLNRYARIVFGLVWFDLFVNLFIYKTHSTHRTYMEHTHTHTQNTHTEHTHKTHTHTHGTHNTHTQNTHTHRTHTHTEHTLTHTNRKNN